MLWKVGGKDEAKPLSWDYWHVGLVFQLVITFIIPWSIAASWSISAYIGPLQHDRSQNSLSFGLVNCFVRYFLILGT